MLSSTRTYTTSDRSVESKECDDVLKVHLDLCTNDNVFSQLSQGLDVLSYVSNALDSCRGMGGLLAENEDFQDSATFC